MTQDVINNFRKKFFWQGPVRNYHFCSMLIIILKLFTISAYSLERDQPSVLKVVPIKLPKRYEDGNCNWNCKPDTSPCNRNIFKRLEIMDFNFEDRKGFGACERIFERDPLLVKVSESCAEAVISCEWIPREMKLSWWMRKVDADFSRDIARTPLLLESDPSSKPNPGHSLPKDKVQELLQRMTEINGGVPATILPAFP